MALMEANLGGGWFSLPTPKPGGYNPSYTQEKLTIHTYKIKLYTKVSKP